MMNFEIGDAFETLEVAYDEFYIAYDTLQGNEM
jgi:hypothetical protein